MDKIKIIKKNDEYSSEYQIGDTFEIEGTWYGVSILSERPAHRFLLIKMNIFIWMPIRKIKQILRL